MDVIYFVKQSKTNDELKYSLRTLKNLPHDKVYFFGGCPDGLKPDVYVPIKQKGTKYDNVKMMYNHVVNSDVSNDFIMMNDDFFIMDKIETIKPCFRCSMYEYIVRIENNYGMASTDYTRRLRKTTAALEQAGLDTKCYELHIPFVYNKEKLKIALQKFPNYKGTRSIYGNMFIKDADKIPDVKILKLNTPLPEGPFISTSDLTWKYFISEPIRQKFNKPSKYEIIE